MRDSTQSENNFQLINAPAQPFNSRNWLPVHLRKTAVYVDITFIDEFGMLQLVKILSAGENQQLKEIDMQ